MCICYEGCSRFDENENVCILLDGFQTEQEVEQFLEQHAFWEDAPDRQEKVKRTIQFWQNDCHCNKDCPFFWRYQK